MFVEKYSVTVLPDFWRGKFSHRHKNKTAIHHPFLISIIFNCLRQRLSLFLLFILIFIFSKTIFVTFFRRNRCNLSSLDLQFWDVCSFLEIDRFVVLSFIDGQILGRINQFTMNNWVHTFSYQLNIYRYSGK